MGIYDGNSCVGIAFVICIWGGSDSFGARYTENGASVCSIFGGGDYRAYISLGRIGGFLYGTLNGVNSCMCMTDNETRFSIKRRYEYDKTTYNIL